MKKIVALVLSLVMALSLATVAFAATYSDAYEWGLEGWEKVDLNGVAISYTSPTEVKVDDEVVAGALGFYTIGGFGPYVEVSKAAADFQMKVDGKVVYLKLVEEVEYDAVGKSVKAGTKCGDYDKEYYDDAVLMEVDGDLYVETGVENDTAVLLNGEVVYAAEAERTVKVLHKWYTLDGKLVVDRDDLKLDDGSKATVLCKNCNVKATVTNKKEDVPVGATCIHDDELRVYMYWTDGAAGSTTETNKDGVESAKTFDAGIAMYVGMSLLSVAGGAVVIGKKKEF